MPKIVDHDERRREIADAMWRVLYRDGIQAVTVRSVAAEAGISKATIAHYFKSQDDLLMFAMTQSVLGVSEKVNMINLNEPDLKAVERAIEHVVPTTSARREQSNIWLAVVARSQSNPDLAQHLAEVNATVLDGIFRVLSAMHEAGILAAHRDPALEAVRLHGLIDGLTLHTLNDPRTLPGTTIREVLKQHLIDLTT